ncbi:hypothetical protein V7138_11285 [Bacillus sp. JJ1533]|uniref:hypothetical protein n=1 Tax=Bacillus sp. JJ1533 TaxID=3122959 RepID=UPI002FFF259A
MYFIFMIPIYAALIWTYLYPEESMLLGQRWMYKEEPEFTDEAIRHTNFGAISGIFLLTMVLALYLIDHFVFRFILILGFISFVIIGGYRQLKRYLDS